MKQKKIFNPLKNINHDIYEQLIEYPISFSEIINCVLKTQDEINEAFDPVKNKFWWMIAPMKSGTNFGGIYENGLRYRLNKIGILHFEEGEHNTGMDLNCIENPKYSIEIKTRKTLQFTNTNDRGRTHESTKYFNDNDNEDHYYILIRHECNLDKIPYTTTVKQIFFGRLSKNDFTNPNGTGAAYLKTDIREKKCIEIWNSTVGNTIENYQKYLNDKK